MTAVSTPTAAATNRNRTGSHDRRLFESFMNLSLALLFVFFCVMLFYSWKIGLAGCMLFAIQFIVLEAISAPPANRPERFILWSRRQQQRRPVLLCIGDSLTHGNMSASFTPLIPLKLCKELGMDPPTQEFTFCDPLWVVNSGQNIITSYTVLNERLNRALNCYPDFVMILIGTNDVLAMYNYIFQQQAVIGNGLPQVPTMELFERNLTQIVEYIRQASPMVRLALCTLPPLGEDLKSKSNQLIRQANEIIERVASNEENKCHVIPLYQKYEAILEKKKRGFNLPIELAHILGFFMFPLYHMPTPFSSFDRISMLTGQSLLFDTIHLNERAADLAADAIVEWLLKANVAKAIAVKGC